MTKRNDGTQLEKLVKLVESIHLPDGFEVETRKPVVADGKQIAELDILVSGTIGTVKHSTLFECRDRPSEGSQGAEWIEQLVGRRQRLKVDTIVAVSTTGFAPDAIRFAKEANIPLRKVEDVTADDIKASIPLTAPVVYRNGHFTDVKLEVVPEDLKDEDYDPESTDRTRIPLLSADKVLVNIETGDRLSLLDLWNVLLKTNDTTIFDGVNRPGDVAVKRIEVQDNVRNAYRVEIGGNRGKIKQLVFTATMSMEAAKTPLAYFKSYDGLHYVAHWEGEEGEDNFTVILTKKVPEATKET